MLSIVAFLRKLEDDKVILGLNSYYLRVRSFVSISNEVLTSFVFIFPSLLYYHSKIYYPFKFILFVLTWYMMSFFSSASVAHIFMYLVLFWFIFNPADTKFFYENWGVITLAVYFYD